MGIRVTTRSAVAVGEDANSGTKYSFFQCGNTQSAIARLLPNAAGSMAISDRSMQLLKFSHCDNVGLSKLFDNEQIRVASDQIFRFTVF